jgi:hypothetical protein
VRGYFFFATRCLQLFELKLQLRDLSDELLALRAEELATALDLDRSNRGTF